MRTAVTIFLLAIGGICAEVSEPKPLGPNDKVEALKAMLKVQSTAKAIAEADTALEKTIANQREQHRQQQAQRQLLLQQASEAYRELLGKLRPAHQAEGCELNMDAEWTSCPEPKKQSKEE